MDIIGSLFALPALILVISLFQMSKEVDRNVSLDRITKTRDQLRAQRDSGQITQERYDELMYRRVGLQGRWPAFIALRRMLPDAIHAYDLLVMRITEYAKLYERVAEETDDPDKRGALETYATCLHAFEREFALDTFPDLEGREALLRTLTAQDCLEKAIDKDRQRDKSGYGLYVKYNYDYPPALNIIEGMQLLAYYQRKCGLPRKEIISRALRCPIGWNQKMRYYPSFKKIQDPPYDSPEFFSEETRSAAMEVAATSAFLGN